MPITHGWTTSEADNPAHDVSADELNAHSGTEDHAHTATADGGVLTSPEVSAKLLLNEQGSDPASPAATKWVLYVKSGGVYAKNSAGTVVGPLAAGGGVSYATPAVVLGSSAAAGAASTVIRSDSTIAAFDATAPTTQAFGDAAVVGTAAFAARRDHKHGMMASNSMLAEATRTITSAEIKALFTTPITLVAGVASSVHWPVAAQVIFRPGGTQYSNVGTNLWFGAPAAQANFANPFFVASAILAEIVEAIAFAGGGGTSQWALSDFEGQALKIYCTGSNPTLGNGTLDVWVLYRTVTV